MRYFNFCILILSILISGCSKIPYVDDNFIISTVADRIDSQVEWRYGFEQDAQVVEFIESAINQELTADTAIQIALFNNPKIQAIFEELGIAQANLVEAGLLSNPTYAVEVRYPHLKNLHTNIEYLITTCFLDVFLIPLRTKLAATEFDQAKLRVSNEILDLAFEVREVFYQLVAEEKKVFYLQSIVDLISISSDLSLKQVEIGNVNNLEFQLARSKYLEAELEYEQSQSEVIRLREKLNRLLGFPEDYCLLIPKEFLEEVDLFEVDLCTLEWIALRERLDLQIARYEIKRICQKLGLKDGWTYTNLKIGLAGEREPEGFNVIGPGFAGELPIFNYGQAARMNLFAQLRQAQDRLAELEIHVLSAVREAYKLLKNYQRIVDYYQNHLLPTQVLISTSSEELYNVMGLGVDQLLENKRQELVAIKNYTENMKKLLVARVELDRVLGGYLTQILDKNTEESM